MDRHWQRDLEGEAERIALRLPEGMRRIFTQSYLCTAKTTVQETADGGIFIVTGDIPAMWLRDSAAQVHHYLPAAAKYDSVYQFIRAVLSRQFFYIEMDPYANAFNAGPTGQHWDRGDRCGQTDWEWERKYETDSLCYPVDLAYQLWKITGRTQHLTESVHRGLKRILEVFRTEQRHRECSEYRFERDTDRSLDTLSCKGLGAPVGYTGMTWSGFRCSDDSCVYGYNIPANMYAAVSMDRTAEMAEILFGDAQLARDAHGLSEEIRHGIQTYGIVRHPVFGDIYAYETDGLGHHLLMDDAGVPGLLSIPYIGYCAPDDPLYLNTRRFVLSRENPYYYEGTVLSGLGSPHSEEGTVWPMGVIMQGMTLTDREDPRPFIRAVAAADDGTGHVHESVHKDDASRYSRAWFAWGDSLYAELILKASDNNWIDR